MAFFRDCNPAGFILFARNVESPDQLRNLVSALREATGRGDAPILIDQEGGRVVRLRPPHWRAAPPQGVFGMLFRENPEAATRAAWLNARLLAAELVEIGVSVNCLPLLDLRLPDAHDIVGDRAFGGEPSTVETLGRAVCDGLLDGGVLPVVKHIPGHGRAGADSHLELPRVATDRATLEASDFMPFKGLADMPLAMTAHIVYEGIDPAAPATTSPVVIGEIIRGWIGFDGLLMTDDLSMKALRGGFAERTAASLAAGCDVVLHCNGDPREMAKVAGAARTLDGNSLRRYQEALKRIARPVSVNLDAAVAELAALTRAQG